MINAIEIQNQFENSYFTLDEELIHLLNKDDQTGQLNNVIIGLNKECFGLRLFEDKEEPILIEIYYVNNNRKLKGNLIRIELNNLNYQFLLLRFCALLAIHYSEINEIHAFNTFQKQLRTILEKDGYFTITNVDIKELRKFGPNGALINLHHKAIKQIDVIPIVDFYREIFKDSYKKVSENHNNYVYLMINTETSLIKIGYSKNPLFREKTLQSQEPQVYLIACWNANKSVETELHRKFKKNRIRGEYFKLNFNELKDLKNFMSEYCL
ncbi:GIY-YIG nuclease family protein [Chryseobacterium tructae]|uniref:GIY-YIG nuclease family protein n=1 Tax=Chryseobacterium tructae TaxID=1037380 RepID=A0ABV7Y3D6_9FLAO|nr:GIY-YIG nuclease family protein [Chryseobacterium tructae]MDN3694271.1 GIY-YIG nuclease family protein [Chryseobacterium tructae]